MDNANPSDAKNVHSEVLPIFTQRANALEALIRTDPDTAMRLAFAPDLLKSLAGSFPEVAAKLETHGTWEGAATHLVFEDPRNPNRPGLLRMQAGAEKLDIFGTQGDPECLSGSTVAVQGVRVNNVVAAPSVVVTKVIKFLGCNPVGPQRAIVIMVSYPGVPLPASITKDFLTTSFFSNTAPSLVTYWQDTSYGKTSLTGTVVGPFVLDRVYQCDEWTQMQTAAIAAADSQVNFTNYNRMFIVYPDIGTCTLAGFAIVGCTQMTSADGTFNSSSAWLLANYMISQDVAVRMASHEGGHGLGLMHGSTRDFGTEALGAPGVSGTINEYGDQFTTMGGSVQTGYNSGQYGAEHKALLTWLTPTQVTSSGTYTVLPLENKTGGVQGLQIQRGTPSNNDWVWIEYRQPIGYYDSLLMTSGFTGAMVHYYDQYTNIHTDLLDFTPGSLSDDNFLDFTDGNLIPGRSWTDPYTNLSLNVVSATPTGLTLNVTYGTTGCTPTPPTVQLSPVNPTMYAGYPNTVTVTVSNNDATACPSSTLTLTSTQPGWSHSFAPTSLVLGPGQSASSILTINVPAGTALGTYNLNATATDATHTGTGTGTLTVASVPGLQVSTTAPTPVPIRVNTTLTTTVLDATGAPVLGANVVFTITGPPPVPTMNFPGVTAVNGVTAVLYWPPVKGTYTVKTSATLGISTGTTTNTFVAQ